MDLTVVTSNPSRWSARHGEKVVRGDLLDLTCPELLIGTSDVVVLPFGCADADVIDFATDLHAAAVICRAFERMEPSTTRLVLAGRAPQPTETAPEVNQRGHLDAGAVQVAEHAAVVIYAMHAHLQWVYVAPPGHVHVSSDVNWRSPRLRDALGRLSAGACGRGSARYVSTIVDVIERCGASASTRARSVHARGPGIVTSRAGALPPQQV